MTDSPFVVPWTSFKTPSDLAEWIGDSDERIETAWNEHSENAPNKWLIAAVDSDQCSFQPLDALAQNCFSDDGLDPREAISEWVLGCFEDFTGMTGEIYSDIDFDLDDEGRIETVGSFALTADNGTVWLAQIEWGVEDEWLVFEYDEASSEFMLMDS
jgi:hypothetical protein